MLDSQLCLCSVCTRATTGFAASYQNHVPTFQTQRYRSTLCVNTTGVALEMLKGGAGEHGAAEGRRLRCSLMGMSLPIDVVVQRILGDPAPWESPSV